MRRLVLIAIVLPMLAFLWVACGEDKIVTVEKEVVKEVKVPGETVIVEKVVQVEVPGETVIVEKVVEVEVPGETVIVEKVVQVEVPGETVIVEKQVVKEVEVPGETVVVEKIIEVEIIPEELAIVATAVAGQTAALTAEGAKYGGTLRVVGEGGPVSLDPGFTGLYVTSEINKHIFEQLFAWDLDFNAQPQMIGEWEVSGDQKTYTFTLREGLSFHDGGSVGPEDVKASIGRWWEKHRVGQITLDFLGGEENFQTLGARSFKLNFETPFQHVLKMWALPSNYAAIYPKRIGELTAFEDIGEANIIGTGPYKLAEWDVGNFVRLERNEAYIPRGEQPSYLAGAQIAYLDQIMILEIPSQETKVAGLQTGEWDVVDGVGLDFFESLNADPDIKIATFLHHQSELLIHTNKAPFAKKEGRQALLAALDNEALLAGLGPKELWFLCGSKYFCGTPNQSNAGIEFYNQNNPQRAANLLVEAGYTGETVVIQGRANNPLVTPIGIALAPMLERVGFVVELLSVEWGGINANIDADNWHIIPAWNALWSVGDPISDVVIAGSVNWGKWEVPNQRFIDAQLDYIKATDPDEQRALLDEIQLLYFTEIPTIWLGQWPKLFPYGTVVKNFQVPAIANYANVWVDR